MSIALLVMTDGRRDCISKSIPSALANLLGPITRRVIHDDSGDPDYWAWLRNEFPTFELIYNEDRQGFGRAIASAWRHIVGAERFVFHLEDDFTFNRPLPLTPIAATLDANPHLVQLALRRQPWNDEERAAGGIVEQHPDDYTEIRVGAASWLEHRRFLTTNPSLYRRSLCRLGWPDVPNSEGMFTQQLLEDPELRFGFWGTRDSGEAVTHIGNERAGVGY